MQRANSGPRHLWAAHLTSTDRSVKPPTAIVTPTTNALLVLQDLQALLVWTAWPVLLVLLANLEKMVVAVPTQAQAIITALRAPLDHLVHLDLPDLLAHPETKALLVLQVRLPEPPSQDHPVHPEIQDQLELQANLDPRDSQAKTQPQAKAPPDPKAQPDLQAHLDPQEPQEPLLAVHLPQDHQDPPARLVATELLALLAVRDRKESLDLLVTMPTIAHAHREPDRRRTRSIEPIFPTTAFFSSINN